MPSRLQEAAKMYETLKTDFAKKTPDLEKCSLHLRNLKIALTQLKFLPSDKNSYSDQEFVLARNVLEIGAQLSIRKKDIPAFERYMSQLKCYYLDYVTEVGIFESPYKQELLGLNLLCLLAQNRVADFHTELERLPAADIQNNEYIKHPVAIEQYLMEGNYNKLFLAKGNVPAESYNFFIDILLGTIRDEIAACMEKSYKNILFSEALRMLYFEDQAEMNNYATKKGWKLESDKCFHFNTSKQNDDVRSLPSGDLAQQMIDYARELEMII
uniref:26S proteasome non-ATPase regulatory subunit 8 n=1 Tax=Phallusia mammillata TaxID=59560 RepID=A0A6F9DP85_9ASCI|nr:26S proteasome non-ATPase regulatory subunit 8-like [Phallusia mammillata]